MSTVNKITFRPILILGKWLGLINFCNTFGSTELLMQYTNSMYLKFLEFTRMAVLIICTYIVYNAEFLNLPRLELIQLWFTIITARLSEIWIIKLINGIIQYDQKLILLPTFLSFHQPSPSIKCVKMFIILFTYSIGFRVFGIYVFPPKKLNFSIIICYVFCRPLLIDIVVVTTTWFFLRNLECRFQTLNDIWKCLPMGLVDVSGEWSHSEIAMSLENIRLLHVELSELLKIFSLGFGPLLLGLFVLSTINIIFWFFYMMLSDPMPGTSFTENIMRNIFPYILCAQDILFMMIIIVAASRISDKKRKIISYLRLYRISSLPVDIMHQVKLFMNQISVFESEEITAYGFFNINLRLVVSILIILIFGLATMIQMKHHPLVLIMVNDTISTAKNSLNNIVKQN